MATPRHLDHAPIVEALVDIQVAPRNGLTFGVLEAAFSSRDLGYYVKGPISEGLFSMQLPADGQRPAATATAAPIGLRLHSMDEKYVLQCRLSGFTLSRVAPYESWEKLIAETTRLWGVYQRLLSPLRICRNAVRFINDLQLPMAHGSSFQQYLEKLVEVPESVPQHVRAFIQRFQLADYDAQAEVVLTLALERGHKGPRVPVFLDIEAFAAVDMPPGSPDLWQSLERLREAKNRVFFGTLTEKALELYQ